MATTTLLPYSTLCSISRTKSTTPSSSSLTLPILRIPQFQSPGNIASRYPNLSLVNKLTKSRTIVRSVAEETLIPEDAEQNTATIEGEEAPTTAIEGGEASTTDQTVSVPVSPSDVLTMFFQAEGSMNEAGIPTVTKALEEAEGITNLKVQVLEGIASVELTKQTTVQAAGVASSLVEIIQGSGFKLQSLNLSFEDEEDIN
ncbi:uncharacterized protein LOC132315810 [Cornus florida]|uniref:uncharacterized protein LOC132315810 n=1 Tax=Cornus florida TaxID=4283 RepID=UPI00289A854D|nr:uncharacterized protein LOC132315810 [Cornus florida]